MSKFDPADFLRREDPLDTIEITKSPLKLSIVITLIVYAYSLGRSDALKDWNKV